MSRVAVWKHLEALRAAGYPLVAGRGGYSLAEGGDFLHPWEFPGREGRVVRYESTDSTMERALELALRDPLSGAIVLAETQTSGRGRLGRPWKSAPGGLFFTMVLSPGLPPEMAGRVGMAAGLALCRSLRDLLSEPFLLEWPNDLLLGGRKVAGLLYEYLAQGETLRFLNLGVGVNVHNRAPGPAALSLSSLGAARAVASPGGPAPLARRLILSRFLDLFEALDPADPLLADEWNLLSGSRGRTVLSRRDEGLLGRTLGIDAEGHILVETQAGRTRSYPSSEAFIHDKEKTP